MAGTAEVKAATTRANHQHHHKRLQQYQEVDKDTNVRAKAKKQLDSAREAQQAICHCTVYDSAFRHLGLADFMLCLGRASGLECRLKWHIERG